MQRGVLILYAIVVATIFTWPMEDGHTVWRIEIMLPATLSFTFGYLLRSVRKMEGRIQHLESRIAEMDASHSPRRMG